MGRNPSFGVLAVLAGLAFAGCGNDEAETPAVCVADADAYLAALEAAPNAVELAGDARISDCLVEGQEGGELAEVGRSLVTAATELNRRAQADPGGDASTQLGYLVGAVQEAAATTGGIHGDLVIRLDAAARLGAGELGAPFERAFGEGYAAGQAEG